MHPRLFLFNDVVHRLFVGSLLLCLLLFSGCEKKTDLSLGEPYSRAIGKSFVLQQDYYIFHFNDSKELVIGSDPELPKEINSKYIGCELHKITIVGIAKKGSIIKIEQIIEENITLAGTFDYFYVSMQGSMELKKLDAFGLVRMINNPPTTKTWSDPPIFDTKAALPLPSDGIWWK